MGDIQRECVKPNTAKEEFSIPGAGGIIITIVDNIEYILIQERFKENRTFENGLFEIPAGKIRAYENIYDCLRREIYEETGLRVELIEGEEESEIIELNGYRVLHYEPFSSSQNIKGYYPILVQVFICHIKDDIVMKLESNESKNVHWEKSSTVKLMLDQEESKFYPMHISTLKKYFKKRNITSG